jgi:hypothetical protein
MKTVLSSLKGILCLFFLLSSCVTSKNSIEQFNYEITSTKDVPSCFVEMNDGTVKNYSTLKLITGIFKPPHLLADGTLIINADKIKIYQNKDHYAVSLNKITGSAKSYVAVETLPGFAVRVVKGKLNVYALKYYNGHNTSEKFFLQSGDEGEISTYTPELLNELLKDNAEAHTFFNEKNKEFSPSKKLLATIEIYNNSKLITKS